MKKRELRRSKRLNPLELKKTSGKLPKSGLSLEPKSRFTWLKRLNPFRKNRPPFSWKRFLIWTGGVIAILLVGIAGVFAYYVHDLPDPSKLLSRPVDQSTKILDRNGNLIYTFYGDQNRTVVTSDQISPYLKEATVSLEDSTFYQNSGYSIKGILRAVWCRIDTHCGEEAGGGSTITQQYIKNALLTDVQTANRKVEELILSIEATQIYTKDQILTGYLNEIPYGSGAYGIEAASQLYFNEPAKNLTLSQAATLAAIPQLPTYYSPYGPNTAALFARKNLVLDRMVANGYITQAQANAAKDAAPSVADPAFSSQGSNLLAPQFVFYIRQQLLNYINPNDPAAAEVQLDQAGYTVYTSLDLPTQEMAQSIVKSMGETMVQKYHASNASLSAVDPNTGEILAMVGSIDYNTSDSGNTNFATAGLQPGSSFKPFVYATAFNQTNKKSPASITYDLDTDFGGGYEPKDYDLQQRGPVTDRVALVNSLNIPAVKNLDIVGVQNAINTAHSMGITTLNNPASSYGLSLVLGSGEVRPVDMANAYGAFANGGTAHVLRPILYIQQNGKTIKDYRTTQGTKAIDPEVAYEINNILSDNNSRRLVFGSLVNNFIIPGRIAAAKSGTTQSFRDGWTVGYTPQISVAVWVGNNDANKTMVNGADGSIVAAPIWKEFMTEYLKGKPAINFAQPSDIKTVTVDKLSGLLPSSQTPPSDEITDVFAPWQIPTTTDNVHTEVNIDKVSGLLATSATPADDVMQQYYCTVHSEMPDNSSWEGPVQAWAAANGCNTSPPTASDNVHVAANVPTVSITSPADDSTVNGQFTIAASVGGPRPITSVQFSVNNVSIGTVTSAPWEMTYNTSSLPSGNVIIQATVTNDYELTATSQVTVTNPGGGTTPGPITDITPAIQTVLHGTVSIKLNWTDPTDAFFKQVIIYQSPVNSTSLGTVIATLGSSATSATIPITGLSPGTYRYTLYSSDGNGNNNTTEQPVTLIISP